MGNTNVKCSPWLTPDWKRTKNLSYNLFIFNPFSCRQFWFLTEVKLNVDVDHLVPTDRFMQSFNRPNLKYEVKPKKPKSLTEEVVNVIKTKFCAQSGIVYCLSRLVNLEIVMLCTVFVQFKKNISFTSLKCMMSCFLKLNLNIKKGWIAG